MAAIPLATLVIQSCDHLRQPSGQAGCYLYLRQVNEVNGGVNAFVRCVCVCLCVRSGRSWELNANSSKTVKSTDLKFDTRVPRESLDMTPKNFPKRGRGHGHVTPKFLGFKCS